MTTQDRIKNWLYRVSQPDGLMEREDMCFLMVQARHLLEESPKIEKYKVVEFYSDWMVHTKLDKSEVSMSILRDITKVIVKNWNPTSNHMVNEVSKVIGLSELRTELIKLFNEYNLPVAIFEIEENWKNLVGFLTYFLADKSISFPKEKPIKKTKFRVIWEEMISFEKPANFWIENLAIIGINDVPHWCVELGGDKKTTKIVGLLTIEKE
ncbi:MAG TPA: hypothetical protein VJB41_03640 [Patescibacteria group bacterium]|uniref:Uncharacterized protein n=1 Tax=Candidatus Nomurabacteria bacterium RIFOXYC2_FULL_36_19 TaxID=1801806 RepID=A0A1F6YWB8_9BACT|nr:MAG: hypothetical protein A2238_03185 [Candidatus Nomurabacteria bacterium RIFOXYA2_FULL_35_9]OGJ10633.1 MAG: hypothetical protein A2456_01415 [Candidatus Nomurabacteria bacterium RIFOXYC2_FULL_36_19]OGJ13597.1 MAG: hypothetical protein A2554_02460 [Candidatus Nomurabacteria bacterium RIFOXYD2_FULL_35_12]HLD31253.1 hypothetical protein [Patescibacteria group bacterium]